MLFANTRHIEKEIIDLSLKNQVLSKSTAFICIIKTKSEEFNHKNLPPEKKNILLPQIGPI